MDETQKELMIRLLDKEIAELMKTREALIAGGSPSATPTAQSTSSAASHAPSKKGHVSPEAKQRLSERMKLVWVKRRAKNAAERSAAEKAIREFDEKHPRR